MRHREILTVSGLSFGFTSGALFSEFGCAVPAGVSLVQGDEGVGKTTLLQLMAGDLRPASGHMQLEGTCFGKDPVSYCQKIFRTDPRSDAFDALGCSDFFAHWAKKYVTFDTHLAKNLAVHLGLGDHLTKPMYMLSTGSKRKMWLATAFACGTTATLLDEPFAALDHRSVDIVIELLANAAQQTHRCWIVADYTPPPAVPLASVIVIDC